MNRFAGPPSIGIPYELFQRQVVDLWPSHTAETLTASGNAKQHGTILCDCTAGDITVTLPPVQNNFGVHYYIKKTDSGANTVIVDGNASETIDGDATVTILYENSTMHIYCSGEAWYII